MKIPDRFKHTVKMHVHTGRTISHREYKMTGIEFARWIMDVVRELILDPTAAAELTLQTNGRTITIEKRERFRTLPPMRTLIILQR